MYILAVLFLRVERFIEKVKWVEYSDIYIISYIKVVYDYVLNIRRGFTMKNNRRQAQFLLRSITDDVPQLLLEENNLVFRNELKEDILIPCSSITSIKILPINRIYNPSVGLLKDGMKGFMAHRNAGVFSISN